MRQRTGLIRTGVIGAILTGAGWGATGALAQTTTSANSAPAWIGALAQAAGMPLKAPAASAEPVPYWWFHGTIEAGGRDFLNDPERNGSAYRNQNSLAKYYEYSTVKPGPFSNIWLSAGSKDGLYQIDFGGKNIGYSDQSYYLDMSKAGQQYLSLGWDQSPHVYSTSAQTPYLGVGTNLLTLPAGLGAANVKNGNASAINPAINKPTSTRRIEEKASERRSEFSLDCSVSCAWTKGPCF